MKKIGRFVLICVYFGLIWTLSQTVQAQIEGTEYLNGRWFDGKGFRPGKFYVVNGLLTKRRPPKVVSTVDLKGKFIIPPFGDAHQHIFNTRREIDADVKNFLEKGIFYVMVQDSLGEVPSDVKSKVNLPSSVDVVYTAVPLIDPRSSLINFFKSLNENGHFGEKLSDEELNSKAFLWLEDKAQLQLKWSKISAINPDFIKVILAFSEEDEKRRQDEKYYDDPDLGMARPGIPPILLPEIVRLAHRDGKRVSVHIETAADFRLAVKSGADIIAHLPGWHIGPTAGFNDESLKHWILTDEDARLAAEKGVAVITTTFPKPFFDNEKLAEKFKQVHQSNLRTLKKHQAAVVIGSDNNEAGVLGELKHLAGFNVFNNSELLKMSVETTPKLIFPNRRIGYLREGFEASFLGLETNPLNDLEALQKITLKVKQGRILPTAENKEMP